MFYGDHILRPFLDHFLYDLIAFCLKTALLTTLKQQFNDQSDKFGFQLLMMCGHFPILNDQIDQYLTERVSTSEPLKFALRLSEKQFFRL